MATALVLGGGTGGVAASNVLRKTLGKNHRVVVVDRKDSYVFQSSYPMLMVNERKPEDITKRLSLLQKKGIDFIQAEVQHFYLQKSSVQTDKGIIDYDFLIISLGTEHHPETVPGFAEAAFNIYNMDDLIRLRTRLQDFKSGKIVLFVSSLPFVCPPAPYEMAFLLDAFFQKRGIRKKIDFTVVTPESSPEPLARPIIGESVRKMMQERQIKLITEAKVLSIDTSAGNLVLDQGINVPADLFLGIPPTWGPSIMRGTGLEVDGAWIEVDPHTLETRNKNVYAIGDAAALRLPVMKVWAPKAGIFAHYQAEVVARNIALRLKGRKPRFRYTGKGL